MMMAMVRMVNGEDDAHDAIIDGDDHDQNDDDGDLIKSTGGAVQ